jgi:hypothetical protein
MPGRKSFPSRARPPSRRTSRRLTRAPNLILLAVPPDTSTPWTQESLLSVVDEALELADSPDGGPRRHATGSRAAAGDYPP